MKTIYNRAALDADLKFEGYVYARPGDAGAFRANFINMGREIWVWVKRGY